MTQESALDKINRFIAQEVNSRLSRRNSILYYRPPRDWDGTVYLFGYTPWRTYHEGKTGYFAFKYRQLRNGNCKLVKSVRFGKRKVARARASSWYDNYYHNGEKQE